MRTILITGKSSVPPQLRELVQRGSTALIEYSAADVVFGRQAVPLDIDRVVFWSASPDPDVDRLAKSYGNAEAASRREIVMFVIAEDAQVSPALNLSPDEVYFWPRDEDRIEMAFLTGA